MFPIALSGTSLSISKPPVAVGGRTFPATFFLNLSTPVGVTLADSQAVITIN